MSPFPAMPPSEGAERTTATAAVIFEARLGPCLAGMYDYALHQLGSAEDAEDAVIAAAEKA